MSVLVATSLFSADDSDSFALVPYFSEVMNKLVSKIPSKIAVAVSGGADSTALLLLAHSWAVEHNVELTVLTVDHKLRAESTKEAHIVADIAKKLAIAHVTLPVVVNAPKTAIQNWARIQRYKHMTQWCTQHGVDYLLLGHHEDDNIETYYMRKQAGSGEDGLAGISAKVERYDVMVLRPLLRISKDLLKKYLHSHGQGWIEDPSNQKMHYTRNAIRAALTDNQKQEARVKLMYYARLREQRELSANRLLLDTVYVTKDNGLVIDITSWAKEAVIGRRVLQHIAMCIGRHDTPPRSAKLERVWQHVHHNKSQHSALRCLWVPQQKEHVWEVHADPRHDSRSVYLNGSVQEYADKNPLNIFGFCCI